MKILYDTQTQKLIAYPRSDDAPVIGLDPRYTVCTLVEQAPPGITSTQMLVPTESIDLNTCTVTRGWQVTQRPLQWDDAQDFTSNFTDAERAAIELSTDQTIANLRLQLTTWRDIMVPTDPRLATGLQQLVTLGILTSERASAILATAH